MFIRIHFGRNFHKCIFSALYRSLLLLLLLLLILLLFAMDRNPLTLISKVYFVIVRTNILYKFFFCCCCWCLYTMVNLHIIWNKWITATTTTIIKTRAHAHANQNEFKIIGIVSRLHFRMSCIFSRWLVSLSAFTNRFSFATCHLGSTLLYNTSHLRLY